MLITKRQRLLPKPLNRTYNASKEASQPSRKLFKHEILNFFPFLANAGLPWFRISWHNRIQIRNPQTNFNHKDLIELSRQAHGLEPSWIGCVSLIMLVVPQVWGRVRAVPEDRHGAATGGGRGGLRAQVQAHWGVRATGLPHSGTSSYSDNRCLVLWIRAQVQAHWGVWAAGLPHLGTLIIYRQPMSCTLGSERKSRLIEESELPDFLTQVPTSSYTERKSRLIEESELPDFLTQVPHHSVIDNRCLVHWDQSSSAAS